jgi:hypothetical protein
MDINALSDFGKSFGTSLGITFAVLVPFAIFFAIYPQYIFKLMTSLFKNNGPMAAADNCAIIPGDTIAVTRVPSAYLAHVAFFFTFIFTNAYYVFNESKKDYTSSNQYDNRRYRSAMIMATVITLYLIIVFARYNITGCDSSLGVLYTTIAFGALGFGTYKFAELCGARSVDILGITTSYVPEAAEVPLACGN